MKKIEKYYNNVELKEPRKNIQAFIREINCKPSKAIELGCGTGEDAIYLIKTAGVYWQ